jgi:hypothetical protein
MGTRRPGREADHSPPSSAEVNECVELYLHFPNTPSLRGAQLNKSTGTTLPLPFIIGESLDGIDLPCQRIIYINTKVVYSFIGHYLQRRFSINIYHSFHSSCKCDSARVGYLQCSSIQLSLTHSSVCGFYASNLRCIVANNFMSVLKVSLKYTYLCLCNKNIYYLA